MMKGVVVRSTGSFYEVEDSSGHVHTCRLKGRFRLKGSRETNPVAVGDHVDIEEDVRGGNMLIVNIYDRHNYLVRQSNKLSKAYQVIASNVDRLMIVATLSQPRTSTGFIDRLLITGEMYHIEPLLVFNKVDVYTEKEKEQVAELQRVYSGLGYSTVLMSAFEISDIEDLKMMLYHTVTLISGHSGVGKSTILNALIPGLTQKTAEVSDYTGKGTHTTTFAEMFRGGNDLRIIDTPGIKDFGLVYVESAELGGYFPEIREVMNDCRFNNCLHRNEPGCAVKESVKMGKMASFRYTNYLNMLEELTIK